MGVFEETTSKNYLQFGFRIYKLVKDGHLDKAGVKEITDFIIPPNEVLNQQKTFKDWILSISNLTIKIKIYSLLTHNFRIIEVKTNKSDAKDGVLGANVKYENYENADKKLLHITSVVDNSFAQKNLGLIPNDDYIIAVKEKNTHIISLNNEEFDPLKVLNLILTYNKGKDLLFYIYNKKNGPRNIEVNIGNEDNFTLGCDVAYGALHEFPKEQGEIIEEIIKEKGDNELKTEEKNEINTNTVEKNEGTKKEEKNDIIEEDII